MKRGGSLCDRLYTMPHSNTQNILPKICSAGNIFPSPPGARWMCLFLFARHFFCLFYGWASLILHEHGYRVLFRWGAATRFIHTGRVNPVRWCQVFASIYPTLATHFQLLVSYLFVWNIPWIRLKCDKFATATTTTTMTPIQCTDYQTHFTWLHFQCLVFDGIGRVSLDFFYLLLSIHILRVSLSVRRQKRRWEDGPHVFFALRQIGIQRLVHT